VEILEDHPGFNPRLIKIVQIPEEKVTVKVDKEVKYKKPKVVSKVLKVKNDKIYRIEERDKDGNLIGTINPDETKEFKKVRIENLA
jgi:hypothetical protein